MFQLKGQWFDPQGWVKDKFAEPGDLWPWFNPIPSLNSWVKLLPLLEKKFGADKCYMFENNVFPREVVLSPPKPQTLPLQEQWKNVSGVNILAHLYKEPIAANLKWMKFKVIVNPRAVFGLTVHGVLSSQRGCAWVNKDIARMYHTRWNNDSHAPARIWSDRHEQQGETLSWLCLLLSLQISDAKTEIRWADLWWATAELQLKPHTRCQQGSEREWTGTWSQHEIDLNCLGTSETCKDCIKIKCEIILNFHPIVPLHLWSFCT